MSSAAGSFLSPETIQREVERQRTFAIISHPDAGKTTLTEKILLYAGAIELAGAVRGRKQQRAATSDWMDVERERGISITSAALEFEILGRHVTLLDTPGHKDFSEDTYRTLLAVDSVVMVIDASKGIEPQTRKLFEVCRQRNLPMLTFVNKLDQPGRDPLDLLDEIESVLQVAAAPMNWPIGDGDRFRGVYDLTRNEVIFYERESRGERRAPASVSHAGDPALVEMLGAEAARGLLDSVHLLADGRDRVRRRGLPRRAADAGLLRQRALQLRSRAVPAGAGRSRASSGAPAQRSRVDRSALAGLHGLCLQDSGEHESAAPRPRRLRARLLGRAVEGHAGDQRAPQQSAAAVAAASLLRARPRDGGLRLSR